MCFVVPTSSSPRLVAPHGHDDGNGNAGGNGAGAVPTASAVTMEAIRTRVIEIVGYVADALMLVLGMLGDAIEPLWACISRADGVDDDAAGPPSSPHDAAAAAAIPIAGASDDGLNGPAIAMPQVVEAVVDSDNDQDFASSDILAEVDASDGRHDDGQDRDATNAAAGGAAVEMLQVEEAGVTPDEGTGSGVAVAAVATTHVEDGMVGLNNFTIPPVERARKSRSARRTRVFVTTAAERTATNSTERLVAANYRCGCAVDSCFVAFDVAAAWTDYVSSVEFEPFAVDEVTSMELLIAVATYDETFRLDATSVWWIVRELVAVDGDVDTALTRISRFTVSPPANRVPPRPAPAVR